MCVIGREPFMWQILFLEAERGDNVLCFQCDVICKNKEVEFWCLTSPCGLGTLNKQLLNKLYVNAAANR